MSVLPKSEELAFGHQSMSPIPIDNFEALFHPGSKFRDLSVDLLHLFRYGPPLIVVLGDMGVNKSVLVEFSLDSLDASLLRPALIEATETLTADDFLRSLIFPWGLDPDISRDNYHQLVISAARQAKSRGETLLAVIYNAELLAAEPSLVLTLILAAARGLPVKFALAVEKSELAGLTHTEKLLEHLPNHYLMKLDPLTQRQARDYLAYRFADAGYSHMPLDDEQLDYVLEHSEGNPRRVNELAQGLLQDTLIVTPRETKVSSPVKPAWLEDLPLPWVHIAGVIAVSVLILGLLFLGSRDPSELATIEPENTVDQGVPTEPAGIKTLAENLTQQGSVATDGSGANSPLADRANSDASDGQPSFEFAVGPVDNGQSLLPPMTAEQNLVAINDVRVEEAAVAQTQVDEREVIVASAADTSAPAAVEAKVEEVAPPAATQGPATGGGQSEAAVEAEIEVASEPANEEAVAAASEPFNPQLDWLKSLPPENYMLQLVATKLKAGVDRLLSDNPGVQELVYYSVDRNGAPLYIVVQGNYANREQASAAIKKLPKSLKKLKPWVKPVSSIQQQLPN